MDQSTQKPLMRMMKEAPPLLEGSAIDFVLLWGLFPWYPFCWGSCLPHQLLLHKLQQWKVSISHLSDVRPLTFIHPSIWVDNLFSVIFFMAPRREEYLILTNVFPTFLVTQNLCLLRVLITQNCFVGLEGSNGTIGSNIRLNGLESHQGNPSFR